MDTARIQVKAGNGGNGCISFRREKFVPRGGPDGGDGGKGGNVILIATLGMSTLIDLHHNPRQIAENGGHGIGKKRDGADGVDCVVKVPAGTIVRDYDTTETLADLTEPDESVVVARGGIGGKGNARFKSSTFQAPRVAEKGEPGETREISLEIKLIADVGLVGYPNAGKSTLLARTSAATPKIAAYPFTTLRPNLGVVRINREQNFVLADIPGLIEGAHKGAGLGHQFLRHIERTKMLIHVIDLSATDGRDPIEDYERLNLELDHYDALLTKLPQIIAVNKIDMPEAQANLTRAQEYFGNRKIFAISAITGDGVNPLMQQAYRSLQYLEARARKEAETTITLEQELPPEPSARFELIETEEGFLVTGAEPRRAVLMTDMENEQALILLYRKLKNMGVINALARAGAVEGDTVQIDEFEFTYSPKAMQSS
ncbi:GTPase ObgE [Candidatus Poribacteria bacterium]|nr:GTPase ObgE [Candidatus Poribacteria bacterium]MYH81094.1 GTPase ObgE [Candidatus Poribacteria bacterium]MYK92420.1 GTPase ObgE [Candidatus Poribacteria bacterium]